MFARRTTIILIALSVAAPAHADSFRTPTMREGPAVSIQAYGHQNTDCVEWTNGCTVCVRGEGHPSCSTPGIACTPAGLTCKHMIAPAKKP